MLSAIAATSLPGIGRLFDRSVPSQAAQQRAADEPARGQGRRPQPIAWQTGMSSDAWRRFWFDWRTLPPGWTAA